MKALCENLKKVMLLIFMAIIIAGVFMGTYVGGDYLTALVYGILILLFLLKFIPYFTGVIKEWGTARIFFVLSVGCLLIKSLWIYRVQVEPTVDYATFYNYAEKLSESWGAPERYVALFPHIFGYSLFVSWFMKIFGASYFLAPILNVILSVISGMMLFKIAYRLVNVQAAVSMYLLWSLCPSQTMYNSLVLSEPLYTMLIITFIFILTEMNLRTMDGRKNSIWSVAVIGVGAGVVLRAVNCCRPISVIFLIAIFIWIFVLRIQELSEPRFRKTWLTFIVTVVCVYLLSGNIWNLYVTKRLGEEPASIPGYNILVGFNSASLGQWNQEDSDLLFYYNRQSGKSADWVQEQMFQEAKERVLTEKIDFFYLMKEKLGVFWGTDDICVEYNSQVIVEKRQLKIISNSFYYAIVLLSLLGALTLWRKTCKTMSFLFPLYVIGLTLAQLLVEVAPRYHYSLIPVLLLIGQYGLFEKDTKRLFWRQYEVTSQL